MLLEELIFSGEAKVAWRTADFEAVPKLTYFIQLLFIDLMKKVVALLPNTIHTIFYPMYGKFKIPFTVRPILNFSNPTGYYLIKQSNGNRNISLAPNRDCCKHLALKHHW